MLSLLIVITIIVIMHSLNNSNRRENLSTEPETKFEAGDELNHQGVELKPQVIEENKHLLNDVLQEKSYTADDRIFNASILSGFKDKIAKENRSKWNNDNWKKYYDYELGTHDQSNRDWWTNDDFELTRAGHVVI